MDKFDRLLMHVGMPANVKGCRYTKEALKLLEEDFTYIEQITKRLYPAVAAECNTTCSRVERAIRHGVEIVFDRMPLELQEKLFGNSVSGARGKATNGEFLATMLLHLEEDAA